MNTTKSHQTELDSKSGFAGASFASAAIRSTTSCASSTSSILDILPAQPIKRGGRPQEPNGMEKSRTLVLVATMRSRTIGSQNQTYLRARCAKLGRPRRATASDFPACAGVPEGTKELIWVHGRRSGGHDDRWGARLAGWTRCAAAQSLREVCPTAPTDAHRNSPPVWLRR